MAYDKKSVKAQFKAADNLNAKYCLVIGEDEIKKGVYVLKNMTDGTQEEVIMETI